MRSANRRTFALVFFFLPVLVAGGCLSFDSLQGGSSSSDGGDATSASDATNDGAGDAISGSDAGVEGGCPSGRGPTMVMIDDVAPPYCIDSTEVTNAEYREFLQANVPLTGQLSPACDGNATYLPQDSAGTSTLWPLAPTLDPNPVASVDWCDAYAFCQWAGKRLCGAIGGGHAAIADHSDANQSQWYHACSKNGTQQYPYGFSYEPLACNGRDLSDGGATVPTGSLATCVGGYPGLFDMAGNVEEREDECSDDGGCLSLGGSYVDYGPSTVDSCGDTSERGTRNSRSGDIGFRCCAF